MKPIRLAFSGSGFKFPALVGGLCATIDGGWTPIEANGTSGGSIIAALLACGMTAPQMKDLCMTRDWSDMLTFSLWSMIAKGGYCSGDNLMEFIQQNTGGKTFAQAQIPLTIMASDVAGMTPFEFSRDLTPSAEVSLAVRASTAIPGVYAPVQFGDTLLQDGGMCDNILADKLVIDNVPRLGIELMSHAERLPVGWHTLFELLARDAMLILQECENAHVELARNSGARFAFIETGYASGLDRNMSKDIRQKLFDDGYKATADILTLIQ